MNAHAQFLETIDEQNESPRKEEGGIRVSNTARESGNKIRKNLDEEAGIFLETGLKSEEDR